MDSITHLYKSKMRLFRDRPDILVKGRWYWCPEGARSIPYLHRFGSYTGDYWTEEVDPMPIGEHKAFLGNNRRQPNPRYTGQQWCGSEEAWTQGILYADRGMPVDAEGVPLCCDAAPLRPGGAEAEGKAEVVHAWMTGGGSLEGGGLVTTAGLAGGGSLEGGGVLGIDLAGGGSLEGGGVVSVTLLGGGSAEGGGVLGVVLVGGGTAEGGGVFKPGVGGGSLEGGGVLGVVLVGGGSAEGGGAISNESGGGELAGGGLVEEEMPTGAIIGFGAAVAPTGWLLCDGSDVSRSTYAALFAVIGTSFGPGDGSTTFRLPGGPGRSMLGAGSGPGLTPRAIGDTGGEEEHQLTTGELATHNHGVTDPGHTHALPVRPTGVTTLPSFPALVNALESPVNTSSSTTGITINNEGSNMPHNTMHPFFVAAFIIKT